MAAPVTDAALLACQFSAWAARYGALAPPAVVLPLGPAFCAEMRRRWGNGGGGGGCNGSSGAHEGSRCSDSDGDTSARLASLFPQLYAAVERAIAHLGGAVAPKLNWSAPTDAAGGGAAGLRCTTAGQVLRLLLASRRAAQDVALLDGIAARAAAAAAAAAGPAAPPPAAPALALRHWEALAPARELRLFVSGRRAVAACQRDPGAFHPELQGPEARRALRDAVCAFHAAHFGAAFWRASCEPYFLCVGFFLYGVWGARFAGFGRAPRWAACPLYSNTRSLSPLSLSFCSPSPHLPPPSCRRHA